MPDHSRRDPGHGLYAKPQAAQPKRDPNPLHSASSDRWPAPEPAQRQQRGRGR
jgi:hypothetical protein